MCFIPARPGVLWAAKCSATRRWGELRAGFFMDLNKKDPTTNGLMDLSYFFNKIKWAIIDPFRSWEACFHTSSGCTPERFFPNMLHRSCLCTGSYLSPILQCLLFCVENRIVYYLLTVWDVISVITSAKTAPQATMGHSNRFLMLMYGLLKP